MDENFYFCVIEKIGCVCYRKDKCSLNSFLLECVIWIDLLNVTINFEKWEHWFSRWIKHGNII